MRSIRRKYSHLWKDCVHRGQRAQSVGEEDIWRKLPESLEEDTPRKTRPGKTSAGKAALLREGRRLRFDLCFNQLRQWLKPWSYAMD